MIKKLYSLDRAQKWIDSHDWCDQISILPIGACAVFEDDEWQVSFLTFSALREWAGH